VIALAALLLAGSAAAAPSWHDGLEWQGKHAAVTESFHGSYVLRGPSGERTIPEPTRRAYTASPLFDGLFAMAQDDLKQDSVSAIRDDAFDHSL